MKKNKTMTTSKHNTKNEVVEAPETTRYEEGMAAINGVFEGAFAKGEEDAFGINVIMGTLALPEKEFSILAETIMNELEKSLNDPNERMLMLQGLNQNGLTAEDAVDSFRMISEKLDKAMTGNFSQKKIDFIKRFFGLLVEGLTATKGIAKRTIPVSIAFCREGVKRPHYANDGDAGMDIYALEDYIIQPGETKIIPTGFQVALPLGYEFQIRPRSGQSVNTKLRIANSPGTIDANYRNEIGVIVENIEPKIKDIVVENTYNEGILSSQKITSIECGEPITIAKGQRFAQMVLSEKPTCLFYNVDTLGPIEGKRAGGFGSSGKF